MKKVLKGMLDWLLFLVSFSGPVAEEAEREGGEAWQSRLK